MLFKPIYSELIAFNSFLPQTCAALNSPPSSLTRASNLFPFSASWEQGGDGQTWWDRVGAGGCVRASLMIFHHGVWQDETETEGDKCARGGTSADGCRPESVLMAVGVNQLCSHSHSWQWHHVESQRCWFKEPRILTNVSLHLP